VNQKTSNPLQNAKKISVVGPVASGKSTLATQLGEILHLPVFHLDSIWNLPNGHKEHPDILMSKIKDIMLEEKWIIDGNYRGTLKDRFETSDVIIWLNFSLEFCHDSAVERHNHGNLTGQPDYFIEPKNAPLFNIEENRKTATQFILPLAEMHRAKVIEFTTREQMNSFMICQEPAFQKPLR